MPPQKPAVPGFGQAVARRSPRVSALRNTVELTDSASCGHSGVTALEANSVSEVAKIALDLY